MDKGFQDYDGGIGGDMHQPKNDFNDNSLTSSQKAARHWQELYTEMTEDGNKSNNVNMQLVGITGSNMASLAVKLADENAAQQKQIADLADRLEKLEQSQKQAKPVNKGPVNPPRHR